MKDLMDQFVLARIVQANALDLTLFQFDYDLTFAAFFMNADGTIYGRFGTRSSHDDAEEDISLEGFRQALIGALALHRRYPANRDSLRGKTGPPPRHAVPEGYPSLKHYQPALDYQGQVARSCMHCHQVRDAERLVHRSAKQPIPEEVLFPYPMPNVVGLKLDPRQRAGVQEVRAGSPAHAAGFQSGDQILTLEGQPLLSIADVQWVLHHAADAAELRAVVRRGEKTMTLTLSLPTAWRRASDISWRVSTWDLRRMGAGGLVLEELPTAERQSAGLEPSQLALRVKHVGAFGQHAAAKNAGFRQGDVLVAVEGQTERMSESQLLTYTLRNKMPGSHMEITVLRAGKRIPLKLPMQ